MTARDLPPLDEPPTGPHGTAVRIPVQDHPTTVSAWIVNAPYAHPFWKQYSVTVVRLADVEGYPPANKQFADVTHELMIVALNPDVDHDPDLIAAGEQTLNHLEPVNVAEQFVADDEAAETVCWFVVRAILQGQLPPEPVLGYEEFRAAWSQAIHSTLDHNKDPHHGAMN